LKYLITGVNGFVGKHFLSYLSDTDHEVFGICRHDFEHPNLTKNYNIDLKDKPAIEQTLSEISPDYIVHLASDSSVGYSWNNPVKSFRNNTNIFLNLIESVRQLGLKCRILSIGSSEEYGNVEASKLPLVESMTLDPISPYAVARVAQEMLSKVYHKGYGLDIIMTRSFNHIGPHQDKRFVIPSFVSKLLGIKSDPKSNKELTTGDLSIIRDFVDVRDVIHAYDLLLKKGKSGEVYNICSGIGTSLVEVLNICADIIGTTYSNIVDPKFIRPNDNKIIIGSNQKIQDAVGWKPSIALQTTLEEIINKYEL